MINIRIDWPILTQLIFRGCFRMVSVFCGRQTFTVLVYERALSLLLLRKLQSKYGCCTFAQWLFTNK
jgi:hypothetical protein